MLSNSILCNTIPLVPFFVVMVVMALVVSYDPSCWHAVETYTMASAAIECLVSEVGWLVVAALVAVVVALGDYLAVKCRFHVHLQ